MSNLAMTKKDYRYDINGVTFFLGKDTIVLMPNLVDGELKFDLLLKNRT